MIVKTFCARMDHGGCGLLVHVDGGRISRIEGDPESPLSHGHLCAKGLAQLERINHPDRLKHPLKRAGKRGEGKWERISWEEALHTVADRIQENIRKDGRKALSFLQGTPKGIELFFMLRLTNLLNLPNVSTPGSICHMPRETAANATFGFFPVPDYNHPPACVVVWGSNPYYTNEEGMIGSQLKRALDRGAKLIVIDPRKTALASRADLWLRPRPGTDLALALGMLRVILEEELYDKAFVENWTLGFAELKAHLQDYSTDLISQTTWVEEGKIVSAARLYAGIRPVCIQWGNALEHTPNSFQCARAISILMAVTGNLDRPGGNVNRVNPTVMRPGEFVQIKKFPDKREQILSPGYRLAARMGFVPSQLIIKAILTGKPDPIRFLYVQGANPLLAYADSKEVHEALVKLDFLAVAELFLTPTAQLADIVLPAATHFEFDDIGHYGLPHGFILARPGIVDPPGECRPDAAIMNELGKLLGLGTYFWEDMEEALDAILRPSGMTYEDLKRAGILRGDWKYRGYEENGFRTPSGKVELYSRSLKDWGYDPLPQFRETPESPHSASDPFKGFPLIFTSAKDPYYFHSSSRNLPSLRRLSPDPAIRIHPETAASSGIMEGDWVTIETVQGAIRQKAIIDPGIDLRVVFLSYGWWYPERGDLELSGWKESNLNILTSGDPPYEPAIGSTSLRAIPCRIRKSDAV